MAPLTEKIKDEYLKKSLTPEEEKEIKINELLQLLVDFRHNYSDYVPPRGEKPDFNTPDYKILKCRYNNITKFYWKLGECDKLGLIYSNEAKEEWKKFRQLQVVPNPAEDTIVKEADVEQINKTLDAVIDDLMNRNKTE